MVDKTAEIGEELVYNYSVQNRGDETQNAEVEFVVNGAIEATKTHPSLEPDETVSDSFNYIIPLDTEFGEMIVQINSLNKPNLSKSRVVDVKRAVNTYSASSDAQIVETINSEPFENATKDIQIEVLGAGGEDSGGFNANQSGVGGSGGYAKMLISPTTESIELKVGSASGDGFFDGGFGPQDALLQAGDGGGSTRVVDASGNLITHVDAGGGAAASGDDEDYGGGGGARGGLGGSAVDEGEDGEGTGEGGDGGSTEDGEYDGEDGGQEVGPAVKETISTVKGGGNASEEDAEVILTYPAP